MTGIVLLIVAVVSSGAYSIVADVFATRNKEGKNTALVFNLLICLTASICWGIYSFVEPGFDVGIIPYALGMGAAFFLTFLFNQLAFARGNASVVTLIMSFALILVAIYGFFFWTSDFSILKIVGLILVSASLFLIIYKKSDDKKLSFLWLIFALIAMIGNAGCTIIEKTQQMDFNSLFGGPFLFISTAFASLLSGIFLLFKRKEVKCVELKKNIVFPVLAGIANFALNLCVILLTRTTLSPTIIYPVISLSIILVLLYSVFIKKEKLTTQQWIGVGVGVVAIVILSI